MCKGMKCIKCKSRYECYYYQDYVGFGNKGIPIDEHGGKKKKSYNLDYYDK